MGKFDGDLDKYRAWIFEVVVALAQVDGRLSQMVEKLVMGKEDMVGKVSVEAWDARNAVGPTLYDRYSSELYGLLVSLTSGEAKGILKGMLDSKWPTDGFKALVVLRRRFDALTGGSILQTFLEVVPPVGIRTQEK